MATGSNGPRFLRLTLHDGIIVRIRSRLVAVYFEDADQKTTLVYVEGIEKPAKVAETAEQIDMLLFPQRAEMEGK